MKRMVFFDIEGVLWEESSYPVRDAYGMLAHGAPVIDKYAARLLREFKNKDFSFNVGIIIKENEFATTDIYLKKKLAKKLHVNRKSVIIIHQNDRKSVIPHSKDDILVDNDEAELSCWDGIKVQYVQGYNIAIQNDYNYNYFKVYNRCVSPAKTVKNILEVLKAHDKNKKK